MMNYNKQILLKILSVFENKIEEGTFCLFIKDAYVGSHRSCNLAWGEPHKSAFNQTEFTRIGSNATLRVEKNVYVNYDEYKEIISSIENNMNLWSCVVFASKEIAYYLYMNGEDKYTIGMSSNIMGRSNVGLLTFSTDRGVWHLSPMQINGAEKDFFTIDEMFDYIVDVIASLGDPYKPSADQLMCEITLDVEKGQILQNEHSWFSF